LSESHAVATATSAHSSAILSIGLIAHLLLASVRCDAHAAGL